MIIHTPQAIGSSGSAGVVIAPWRTLFLQHLAQMQAPICSVATVHYASATATTTATPTPRVRHCVCRGLWGSLLPDRASNPAPRNPAIYESDMPVFTTDARMAKAVEITGQEGPLTAGGGAVEAVWWAAAAGHQWRIRGTAWLLGPDVDEDGGAEARAAIGARMRTVSPANTTNLQDWKWSTEVTAHFGNISPAMRGSFCNPSPGTPRPTPSEPGQGLGKPVGNDDLHNIEARTNFRVVVIVPDQVDVVDLSRGDDARRWMYTYVGGSTGWETVEVWP